MNRPQSAAQIGTDIATLTRVFDVDPELGHKLRVAAYDGRFSPEQADAVIALLQQLPGRRGAR